MASLAVGEAVVLETIDVFQVGSIDYKALNLDTSDASSPPKPLLIYTPIVAGEYPVILFCHGFYLRNHFYSDLLKHIASHGYILVAPQVSIHPYKLNTILPLFIHIDRWMNSRLIK